MDKTNQNLQVNELRAELDKVIEHRNSLRNYCGRLEGGIVALYNKYEKDDFEEKNEITRELGDLVGLIE